MMKIDADEFMKTYPARKRVSVLEPFRGEIFKLKYAGYSIRQIAEFLALNNVTISSNALNSFIKTRQKIAPKKGGQSGGPSAKTNSLSPHDSENPSFDSGIVRTSPAVSEKKRELVEINGRMMDVNYKPSWVDDDINLKDLL